MDECPSLLTDLYTNTQTALSRTAAAIFPSDFFFPAFFPLTDYGGVPPSPPILPALCLSLISITPCLPSKLEEKDKCTL